jgi:hypothetical protein
MKTIQTYHCGKLCLYLLLSLADLLLTRQLVGGSPTEVYESNPIANAWLHAYGWAGLAAYKALAVLVVIGLVTLIFLHRPKLSGRVLQFACMATGSVVVYSCLLLGCLGSTTGPLQAAEKRIAHAHEHWTGPTSSPTFVKLTFKK